MGKWTSRGHAHAVHAAFRCKYCSFMLLPAAQTAEALLFYPRCGVCVRHLCEKRGQTLLPIPHILLKSIALPPCMPLGRGTPTSRMKSFAPVATPFHSANLGAGASGAAAVVGEN